MVSAVFAAQPGTDRSEFEVVSIRAVGPGFRHTVEWGAPGPVRPDGSYVNPGASVGELIAFAYPGAATPNVTLYGLPSWTREFPGAIYDIEAKPPAGIHPDRAQMRQMMQGVLRDRFGLRFHMESRTLPVYFLEVAPTGTRNIREVGSGEKDLKGWVGIQWSYVAFMADPISMAGFAKRIEGFFRRPVLDRTGMTGLYAINMPPKREPAPPRNAPLLSSSERLKRALPVELGLRLAPGNARVAVMVIDHLARPTPN